MLPEKVKAIREMLGITETQVSQTINVNSYKYKRGESNIAYLSTEMIILLSIIYKVPFEKLIVLEYSVDEILKNEFLINLKELDSEQIVDTFKDNMCSYFPKKRRKANSTTIDLILKNERKAFAEKLKGIREYRTIEISTIAQILGITETMYKNFESGSTFPTLEQLIKLSEHLATPIRKLISI